MQSTRAALTNHSSSGAPSPEDDSALIERWTTMTDLAARSLDVTAAMLVRPTRDALQVVALARFEDQSMRDLGATEEQCLQSVQRYCRHVLRSRTRLLISNATEDVTWASSHDGKSRARSYLGFPLCWPNGEIYGIFCAVDRKPRFYRDHELDLMQHFVDSMARDLDQIEGGTGSDAFNEGAPAEWADRALDREAFLRQGAQEVNRSRRHHRVFTVCAVRIDNLSELFGRYGPDARSQALSKLCECLDLQKRAEDVLGRMGREDFAVLLPETRLAAATRFAERVRTKTARIVIDTPDGEQALSISIGLTTCHNGDQGLQRLLNQADQALREARSGGGNRVASYRSRHSELRKTTSVFSNAGL